MGLSVGVEEAVSGIGHGRLTISPACPDMTLLIPRVAHLAKRAPQKASFDARSEGQAAHPLQLGRERKRL
jgi:hypothetical protein